MDYTDGPPTGKRDKEEDQLSGLIDDQIKKGEKLEGMFRWKEYKEKPDIPQDHYKNIAEANGSDLFYDMDKRSHGLMLIINNRNFLLRTDKTKHRIGTDVDALGLKDMFLKKGFDVDLRRDLTCEKIVAAIKETVKTIGKDRKEYSCVACAILTHGGMDDAIYGVDEVVICFEKLRADFCVEDLAGIAKLFFIQACRGVKYMKSYDVVDSPPNEKPKTVSLPSEADCLCAHSTVSGFSSWRNGNGSWFIQSLIEVFSENSHRMDIIRMLTRVNNKMAERFSYTGEFETHNKRQVLAITSHLRYEFFFFPPWGAPAKVNS